LWGLTDQSPGGSFYLGRQEIQEQFWDNENMSKGVFNPRRFGFVIAAVFLSSGLWGAQISVAQTQPSSPQAVYKWRDASGQLVVSDRPVNDPKVEVKRTEIAVGRTASGGVRLAVAPSSDEARAAKSAQDGAPASGANKAPTRQELAKREEEASRQKEACENMRTALRTLESGIRVREVNAQGEQEFLSDENRARRIGGLQRDLASTCKS
jgi:Domain of unknown function (DUF4124)